MISFIVPATDKDKVKKLSASLDELKIDLELIPIYGATSMFDAWNKGLKKAKGKYICLTHEDTQYMAFPDLDKYFRESVGMIGTAGTTVIHRDQPWWFSRERYDGKILSGQIWNTGEKDPQYSIFGDFGEVVILDGVCMITTKEILKSLMPKLLNKKYTWDFYDHVLSLEMIKHGYKLLTVPMIIIHDSKGGDKRQSFFDSMDKFRDEYLNKTWRI